MNVRRKVPQVNLRQRTLPSGKIALYFDISIDGQRKRESLNLFLEPGNTRAVKEKNKETMLIANEVLANRQRAETIAAEGIEDTVDGLDRPFFDYFMHIQSKKTNSTSKLYNMCMKYLKRYEGNENITFRRINRAWVEGFKNYLESASGLKGREKIKSSSAMVIFSKLITVLNEAVKDGLISRSPAVAVDRIDFKSAEREYLTKEELKRFIEAPLPLTNIERIDNHRAIVKRAFIFSTMTGLRISDVMALKWSNVKENDGKTMIVFNQQKTGGLMYHHINELARRQLGQQAEQDTKIFDIIYSQVYSELPSLLQAAGITKKITFHCARHTNATLLLESGTDIYTVSKMLGHTNIKTTQIYAKIVDKQKEDAAERLNNFI